MSTLERLIQDYPSLASLKGKIMEAYKLLLACFQEGGKLLLCGNGGSCCDCQHIAGELMKSFLLPRPLDGKAKSALAAYGQEGTMLGESLQRGLPVIVLSDMQGLTTAFANDVDPDACYAQQAYVFADPGDVLLGISTSGNAHNVRLAAIAAKARGAKVIALTGEGGGKLKELCDVLLNVPDRETYRIQELHLPVYHALCAMLEESLFGGAKQ